MMTKALSTIYATFRGGIYLVVRRWNELSKLRKMPHPNQYPGTGHPVMALHTMLITKVGSHNLGHGCDLKQVEAWWIQVPSPVRYHAQDTTCDTPSCHIIWTPTCRHDFFLYTIQSWEPKEAAIFLEFSTSLKHQATNTENNQHETLCFKLLLTKDFPLGSLRVKGS